MNDKNIKYVILSEVLRNRTKSKDLLYSGVMRTGEGENGSVGVSECGRGGEREYGRSGEIDSSAP